MDEAVVSKEVCDLHTRQFEATLSNHEETIKQLTECTQKLTFIISTQEEKQKEIDNRLKVIERKPNVVFEKILITALTAAVTVLVTALITVAISGGA